MTIDITNICKDLHRIVPEVLKGGEAEGHPSRINLRYRAVYLSDLGHGPGPAGPIRKGHKYWTCMIWADNMAYWYQGEEFTELDTLMEAVRLDVDGYFGDSDLDSVIAQRGGRVEADGTEYRTAVSLKRGNPSAYRAMRDEIVAGIVDRLRNSVELGELPAEVPYTSGKIESDM